MSDQRTRSWSSSRDNPGTLKPPACRASHHDDDVFVDHDDDVFVDYDDGDHHFVDHDDGDHHFVDHDDHHHVNDDDTPGVPCKPLSALQLIRLFGGSPTGWEDGRMAIQWQSILTNMWILLLLQNSGVNSCYVV